MSEDFGLKISLKGEDTDSQDLKDFVIKSTNKALKVQVGISPAHSAIVDHTFNNNPGVGTITLFSIAHGYNYFPMSLCMVSSSKFGSDVFYLAPFTFDFGFSTGARQIDYDAFDDKFVVYLTTVDNGDVGALPSLDGVTFSFKYYITTEDGVTN